MPKWRWRCGWRRRGRPPSELFLHRLPLVRSFMPEPLIDNRPVVLLYPELEALRLIDLENLTHGEAAARMGTSRGTVWRLVRSARMKVVSALMEGRPLVIAREGEVEEVG